jgi:hypothetical protein
MSKRSTNTKESQRLREVQIFVGLGLVVGVFLIIVGGWLARSDNRNTSTAQTTPNASSTIVINQ